MIDYDILTIDQHIRSTCAEAEKISKTRLFIYGVKNAVIFVSFIMEIIEYAIKNKLDKIYYCTREGEFFKAIHDCIAKSKILDMELPESELIEVSRMATFAPSIYDFTVEELKRLWTQYHNQSLVSFYKSLNVDIDPYVRFFKKYGIDHQKIIPNISEDSKVKCLLSDVEYVSLMKREVEGKRKLLKEYLKEKGFEKSNTVFMVDIGWRGSIQDNIAITYPEKNVIGYYFGLFDSFYDYIPNCKKIGYMNLNDTPESMWCLNYVDPIEMLCNSKNGSVKGYQNLDGNVIAMRDDFKSESIIFDKYISEFQKGVLTAANLWGDHERYFLSATHNLKKYALCEFESLIGTPQKELAKAYFDSYHNELFGKGIVEKKQSKIQIGIIIKGGVFKKKRKEFWNYINECHWPQAFLTAKGMRFLLDEYNKNVRESWKNIAERARNISNKRIVFDESLLILSDNICYYVESEIRREKTLEIIGWAIYNGKSSDSQKVLVALESPKKWLFFDTCAVERKDVTQFFNDGINYDMSGFTCSINCAEILDSQYRVNIVISRENKYFMKTDC